MSGPVVLPPRGGAIAFNALDPVGWDPRHSADKGSMVRRWLTLAVIVTGLSGCDNVAWGGTDVRLQPPPEKERPDPADLPEAEPEIPLPDLPEGPVLLAGLRNGSEATLVVVGEIRPDGLAPLSTEEEAPGFLAHFSEQRLAPGSQFVLFSQGVRIGRLTATGSGTDERFCQARPTVTGIVEIVPDAANARNVLALPADAASDRPYDTHRSWAETEDVRRASLAMGSQAVPAVGAPWPPSLLESRADLQAFRLPEAEGLTIASTFLYGQRLAIEEPGANAYSLFVMGTEAETGYRREYTWYRRADGDGKGAPRYFEHLDWDGDGASEVLLDVFGSDSRWFAGLELVGGDWDRTFQDPCGAGGAAG